MENEETSRGAIAARAGALLDRAEFFYLRILRAAILIVATVLLIYALWLGISSLYKMSRSPSSVVEVQANVAADELTGARLPAKRSLEEGSDEAVINPEHKKFYDGFAKRYYALFRSKFEPFRQSDDKRLNLNEFDDSFINTSARLEAIKDGELNFADDVSHLGGLMNVMTEAAQKPEAQKRLGGYRAAKKVPVTRKVQRTRTTYRSGWDTLSSNCPGWYESPIGCPVQRPVQTAYTEQVTTNEFPEGTQSHSDIFRAFQERYFTLLEERRSRNRSKAEAERRTIANGIVAGRTSLVTTLEILGGFLILMFFFLLIAIERHQRWLAGRVAEPMPAAAPV